MLHYNLMTRVSDYKSIFNFFVIKLTIASSVKRDSCVAEHFYRSSETSDSTFNLDIHQIFSL